MFKIPSLDILCKKICIRYDFKVIYIMALDKDKTQRPRGLTLHSQAPIINTVDIYNNPVNLENLLKNHNGVLVDFFRGTW